MAKIFKPSKQLKSRKHASASKQLGHFEGVVEKYDLQLKGIVTNPHNKVAFVPGVVKGEVIKVNALNYTDKVIQGEALEILNPSPERVTPQCKHFDECGGCQIQYLSNDTQINEKQRALQELMFKAMGASDDIWQPAIQSQAWGYRRAARLATWEKSKKELNQNNASASPLNVGFRAQKSKHVIDIEECPVLNPALTQLSLQLKDKLNGLTQREGKLDTALLATVKSLTHIQLFALNDYNAIVVRIVKSQPKLLVDALTAFAQTNNVHMIVEFDENEYKVLHAHPQANDLQLSYQADGLTFDFTAKDFIQVNEEVNNKMIAQAMEWLNPQPQDTILDLFSGVGNFTLPLATRAKHVIGVEGVFNMVKQLKHNASLNNLDNVEAYQADLSQFDEKRPPKWLKPIDKLLLDPARDGAHAVMQTIPKLKPKHILYISCNPTTMVRDIKMLESAGYRLKKAGILNMFPNTSHVEAMVLLEK